MTSNQCARGDPYAKRAVLSSRKGRGTVNAGWRTI